MILGLVALLGSLASEAGTVDGMPVGNPANPSIAMPRVRDEVRQRIATEGRARVLVAFGIPGSRQRIALARSASERANVVATAQRIRGRLAAGDFENVGSLSCVSLLGFDK